MTSVVSIFCEDIREERSGQDTIIGILPDNMLVPMSGTPRPMQALPKLCVYVRIHLDIDSRPQSISSGLFSPDGIELVLQTWDPSTIDTAYSQARANGMPVVGLVLKAIMGPFPVPSPGKIVSKVTIDDVEFIGGRLESLFFVLSASLAE